MHERKRDFEKLKPFSCTICSHWSSPPNDLVKHVDNTHSSLRNSCEDDIELDSSIHEGEKPFKCDSCDNSCSYMTNLDGHIATIHEEKKPSKHRKVVPKKIAVSCSGMMKPLKCEFCDTWFFKDELSRDHVISDHAGNNPYKCSICEATFVRKWNMEFHKIKNLHVRFATKMSK